MAGTGASGGRNAKGTAAHVLAGTFRADRHGEHATPEAPRGTPEPPKVLTGDARAEWDRMVGRLERMGTLSSVDDAALYQYCLLFAETEARVERQAKLLERVDILEDQLTEEMSGADRAKCIQAIAKMAIMAGSYDAKIRQDRMALRQYLVEFGMTPAARSRVKLPAQKPKSKVEEFLARRTGA